MAVKKCNNSAWIFRTNENSFKSGEAISSKSVGVKNKEISAMNVWL